MSYHDAATSGWLDLYKLSTEDLARLMDDCEYQLKLRTHVACDGCLPPSQDEPELNDCAACGGIQTREWTASDTHLVSGF